MRKRAKKRRKAPRRNGRFEELIAANAYTALRDESYTIIARLVDETLKDPKLRERIQYHTRQILKLIAENL